MRPPLPWVQSPATFLLIGLLFLPCAQARAALATEEPGSVGLFPNGIAAGEVTSESAVLWTRYSGPGAVTFAVSRSAQFEANEWQTQAEIEDSAVPLKVAVPDLTPGVLYYYRVTDVAGNSVTGQFRTAAPPGDFHGLRFGVSGDWRGELAPFAALGNAPGRSLAFFVALGDTIYADYPSPAVPQVPIRTIPEFRAKHAEVYSARFGVNALGAIRAKAAWWAMLDDHEVVNDFAGGAPPATDPRFGATGAFINETDLFKAAMQAFLEYNPVQGRAYDTPEEPRTHGKPKLYRHQVYGSDAAVFLLDARSFRDPGLPAVSNPFDTEGARRFNWTAFDRDPATGADLPQRTMLGAAQLRELKTDLLRARDQGVLWKFILVGEPVQQLGFADASDRFEGYARERSDLLRFITEQGIGNVVFISADMHGTAVNNLNYQAGPEQPLVPTGAFEVVTGSVAHDKPFGPSAFDVAAGIRVLPGLTLLQGLLNYIQVPDRAAFEALPLRERDRLFKTLMDVQLTAIALDPTGLDGSGLDAVLLEGNYVAVHTYGWTEFDIDPVTHWLTVTTFGIAPYSAAETDTALLTRVPEVVSRFVVRPQSEAPHYPAISLSKSGQTFEVTWPAWADRFTLQTRTASAPAEWTDLDVAAEMVGGTNRLKVASESEARFFRLRRR